MEPKQGIGQNIRANVPVANRLPWLQRLDQAINDYARPVLAACLGLHLLVTNYKFSLSMAPRDLATAQFLQNSFELGLILELLFQHCANRRKIPAEGIKERMYEWFRDPRNQTLIYKAACLAGLILFATSEHSVFQTFAFASFG